MDNKFSVNLQEYAVTGVTCPDCGKHYALRLHWTFIEAHRGQDIAVVCSSCSQKRISKKEVGN